VSGWGFDGSVIARLTDAFSVNGSVGWNSLEFQSDTLQQGAVLFPTGDRMNLSPELTVGVGAEYRWPLSGSLEGFVAGDARYTSQLINHDVVGGFSVVTESDDVRNLNLRGGVDADRWSLTLFADNVTDERGAIEPGSTSLPYPVRQRPRTIGLQLTFTD